MKDLLATAPWRGEVDSDKFKGANLRATNQPGSTPKMYVPGKKPDSSRNGQDENSLVFDPELRYSFQRNLRFLQSVFSIDTIVKPLPPTIAYYASRNLSFFTSIFTQFFDPAGIQNAQKSLGLGHEERERRVR
ncbi:hypothetical protein ZOSMA_105G00610 [Zostera marina]|uniref:Uncharacterized protein n=1 Tax=Zostera marina TaxID=29655 RepID=A0A0K9Q663_ZOSMR|nr:hypothetical protein ZOSMA_105G00610 [Zostera marina]